MSNDEDKKSHSSSKQISSEATNEKYQAKRRKNNEQVKRSREKKKAEIERIKDSFSANEKRIEHLQNVITDLSKELEDSQGASSSRQRNPPEENKQTKSRPSWFGDAF